MLALVAMVIVAILIVAIGWKVWRLRPHSHDRILFFTLTLIISSWMLCNYFSMTTTDPGAFLLFVRLVMIITDLLPPVLFLFSLSFPRQQIHMRRRRQIALACWTLVVTGLNFTTYVFPSCYWKNDKLLPQPGWGFVIVLINMLVLISLACYNFFQKSKQARGLEKIRLTYFAFSFSLAMVIAVVFNLILPALFQNSSFMNIGIMFMGLTFIGVTGYSMLKTTFSSLDLLIAKGVFYLVLLVWPTLPLVAHYHLPVNDTPLLAGITFILFLAWMGAFVYIYNHLDKFLIKKIVNHGADWQHEKQKFLTRLRDELDYETIITETLNFFAKLIKNSGNLIVGDFMDEDEIRAWGQLAPAAQKIYSLVRGLWLHKNTGPWLLEQIETDPQLSKLTIAMKRYGIAAVFPIVIYDEYKGVLLFGNKINGNPFFIQDIDLIEQTLDELAPLLNKAIIHQTTEDFNTHLQRRINSATSRLRRMNQKLIAADKLKDEFVSVASHELRTPMTAIKGYLWLVAKNNTPEQLATNQKYIEIALNSTERLIALVNDMLTISRIEGGRFALNLDIIDARQLVSQIQTELLPIAADKKLFFKIKNPREKMLIKADSKRILEVLHNLTGNALKFTPQGGVTMITRADDKYVYIDVIDTGVGIDEQDFNKLFSKFARMEKSYVKIKETGTGLGLYISRQIMKMHHGDITFSSRRDHGSTFTIYLPRAPQK
ncbi:hypothetical protein IJJ08_03640 [bacterium]|nr:hypothetical protein [bacterium]